MNDDFAVLRGRLAQDKGIYVGLLATTSEIRALLAAYDAAVKRADDMQRLHGTFERVKIDLAKRQRPME